MAGLLDSPTKRGKPHEVLYPDNATAGHGANLIAQVLAQGQSPRIGQLFSPANFRRADGGTGNLLQYAPRAVKLGQGGNFENQWIDWLSKMGIGRPSNPGAGPAPGPAPAPGPGQNPVPGPMPGPGAGPAPMPSPVNPRQAWQQSLTPEQLALRGGAQGNQDFRASLTPQQIALQRAAQAWRAGGMQSAAPGGGAPPAPAQGAAMGLTPEQLAMLMQLIGGGGGQGGGNLGLGQIP